MYDERTRDMSFIFLILFIVFLIKWKNEKKSREQSETLKTELEAELLTKTNENADLNAKVANLSKYEGIADIDKEIKIRLEQCEKDIDNAQKESNAKIEYERSQMQAELQSAKQEAKEIREKAKDKLDIATEKAEKQLQSASAQAKKIIADAEEQAKDISGEAYEIAGKAKELEKTVIAMKNTISGYGTEYLKPTYSLLDELAADFGHTEAGQKLKEARENSARMVKAGLAATCDYVENNRKTTAIAFVIDAFNGKVDSILTKTKKDNYGTLEQRIKDAYQMVNNNGTAFRNARITNEYLMARLEELKWGTITSELKAQAQEEQKLLREQMREEERARREYEKAIKEAAKEEEMLRNAMEKAQQQMATANEAKKAEYEAKLAELQQKLVEAEERGQRAVSMAQQTKHGNVYVISNVGSFGENVYKVGMTRRLNPLDRVKELGDASVPFPFDVHAVIECDNAPNVETSLHKSLALTQLNKVNPRKEFFKVQLSDIRTIVEKMGLVANWTMEAEAAEYRETLVIEEEMKKDPDKRKQWEEYTAGLERGDGE